MIKVNVEVNNKSWHKKITNPKKYFNKKLKKISKIVKFFKGKNITFTILLTNSLNMKKLNNFGNFSQFLIKILFWILYFFAPGFVVYFNINLYH